MFKLTYVIVLFSVALFALIGNVAATIEIDGAALASQGAIAQTSATAAVVFSKTNSPTASSVTVSGATGTFTVGSTGLVEVYLGGTVTKTNCSPIGGNGANLELIRTSDGAVVADSVNNPTPIIWATAGQTFQAKVVVVGTCTYSLSSAVARMVMDVNNN